MKTLRISTEIENESVLFFAWIFGDFSGEAKKKKKSKNSGAVGQVFPLNQIEEVALQQSLGAKILQEFVYI